MTLIVDVIEGRAQWGLVHGSMLDVLPAFPADSIDASVTDPPYELGFMGKRWDSTGIAFRAETWAAVLRVLKPGAHLLAFGGSRTSHRIACAIEDAGFEIRDSIVWMYATGFPKSLNLGDGRGTALKPAHEPIIVARKPVVGTVKANVERYGTGGINVDACRVGTSKRVPSSISENGALGWGTGAATNDGKDPSIDRWPPNVVFSHSAECRRIGERTVRSDGHFPATRPSGSDIAGANGHSGQAGLNEHYTDGETVAAWDCVPGCPVRALDEQSGELKSGAFPPGMQVAGMGYHGGNGYTPPPHDAETGTASRFFPQFAWDALDDVTPFLYAAKAARSEREEGCRALPLRTAGEAVDREEGSAGINNPRAGAGRTARNGVRNIHPTVKPVALMRWLIRLVTPIGGVLVDPFYGSGTTGVAAMHERRRVIGVELDAEGHGYVGIGQARTAHAETHREAQQGSLFATGVA